jgi:nucleotide-binding universal stress UspA family protein
MYSKVVVPLDGSKLAEVVLQHLEAIIKAFDVKEVMLVSVTEKLKGTLPKKQAFEQFVYEKPRYEPPTQVMAGQHVVYWSRPTDPQTVPVALGKMTRTAVNYLCRVAERLEKNKYDIGICVLAGNPAEEIVGLSEARGADLILMASRGKTGFSRWDMGNIAEKVIKATRATVMLVKPEPGFKETRPKRRGVSS